MLVGFKVKVNLVYIKNIHNLKNILYINKSIMHTRNCIVSSCHNSSGFKRNHTGTVFKFPTSDYHQQTFKRLNKWCGALNINPEILSTFKNIGVCSRHFKPEQITNTLFKTRLAWSAVPELYLNENTELTMGNTNATSKVIEISDSENEDETPSKSNEATDSTTQKIDERLNVATGDNNLENNQVPTDDKYDIIIDSDDDADIATKDSDNQDNSKTYYPPEFINIDIFNKIESKNTTPELKCDLDKNDVIRIKTDNIIVPKINDNIIELFDDVMETDDTKDNEQTNRPSVVIPMVTGDEKISEPEIIDLDKNDLNEFVEVPKTQHTISEIINEKLTHLYHNTGGIPLDKNEINKKNVGEPSKADKSDKPNVEIIKASELDINNDKYSDEPAQKMEIDENQICKGGSPKQVKEIIPNETLSDALINYSNVQAEKKIMEDEVIDLDDSGDSETIANEIDVQPATSQILVEVSKIKPNENVVCQPIPSNSNAKIAIKNDSFHDEHIEADDKKAAGNVLISDANVTSDTQTTISNEQSVIKRVPINAEKANNTLVEDDIIDLDATENEVLSHDSEVETPFCESKTNDNNISKATKTGDIFSETPSDADNQPGKSGVIICLDGNDIDDNKGADEQVDSNPDTPQEIENEKPDQEDKTINDEDNFKQVDQSSEIKMETNKNANIVIDLDLDNNDGEITIATQAEANDKQVCDEIENNVENTIIDSQPNDIEMEVQVEKQETVAGDIVYPSNSDVAANNELEKILEETCVSNQTETKMDVDIVVNNPLSDCVNYHCSKTTSITSPAPIFVLSFYRINKKSNKRQFVCAKCYDDCVAQYEQMTGDIIAHKPIVYKPKAQPDLIELSDSDDDDVSLTKRKNAIYNKTRNYIENSESNRSAIGNLEELIEKAFSQINIDMQLKKRTDIINKTIEKNEATSTVLFNDIRELQKSADKMHFTLYQKYPNRIIKELPPIDLNKEDKLNLPPIGDINYPPIQIGKKYLAPRHAISGAWVECDALEICANHPTDPRKNGTHCKVMFCRRATKLVLSIKHIAYSVPPDVRLNVGTRVVAIFQQVPVPKQSFFPGTVGETLKESNKYRYLIFFDDGYCQYVRLEHVRLICEVSTKVWEDIDGNPGTSRFIQEFLTQFHNRISRPMLLAKRGQKIVTEFNGIWKLSKVVDVDCNLIKMYIEKNQTFEWIYRGSSRFAPIFKHRQIGNDLQLSAINYHLKKRNEPYIEMTLDEISDGNYQSTDNNRVTETQADLKGLGQPVVNRAVARKSTNQSKTSGNNGAVNKAPVSLNNSVIVVDDDKTPKGKVTYYETTKRYSTTTYVAHNCTPACLVRVEDNLEPFNPIARPLLSGWERQICKYKSRKIAIYRAPCGRRLRTMLEVHRYLRLTDSPLNVECFDYDTTMHCLAEYTDLPQYIRNTDLSDGTEKMPISCCNYFDKTTPPTCSYSTNRIPTEGVNLNLNPDFLCACDCEDDCIDKSKCQCWQLTIKGARSINSASPVDDIGYCFKRLLNPVPTGIYECNSRCKCKQNCLNRVVQHPLSVKLQVFKTTNRGWGLRTLHDIPKGSFICIYAGDLLTEQSSNELGAKEGDEYFAELDYIEAVEGLKEGYESDIPREEGDDEPEGERDDDFENSGESDDDDFTSKCKAIDKKITTRSSTRSAKKQDNKSVSSNRVSSATTNTTTTTTSVAATPEDEDCITISDDEEVRAPVNFIPNTSYDDDTEVDSKYKSVRKLFGKDELGYVMDAKRNGNIGRYFNHSCNPNLFVQNVFVDTHDLRFPWVTFFSNTSIQAGTELTWNYNYDVGCVPGKVLYCQCDSSNCRGRLL